MHLTIFFSFIFFYYKKITADGFTSVYDREVPIELRIRANLETEEAEEEGSLESIKAKACVKTDTEQGTTSVLKIELSSEADLFFHYTAYIDEGLFASIREEQKLTVDFEGYITLVLKIFYPILVFYNFFYQF